MNACFDCTQCGRCCHDLRLTLSVAEARVWASRGHRVDVVTEGWPWPDNGDSNDRVMQWRRVTSFDARVGDVPFRINLRLVARHEGACPYLLPDMRCGNYQARPRICRIYPLESRPFEPMVPEQRLCPPEAWEDGLPVLERNGEPADTAMAAVVAAHRAAMVADGAVKARLPGVLGFFDVAMAGEGLAVCEMSPATLLEALEAAEAGLGDGLHAWTIVTNRKTTRAMLADLDCPARLVSSGQGFLGSFADDAAG